MKIWNDNLYLVTVSDQQMLYAMRLSGLNTKIELIAHQSFVNCKIRKLAFGISHMMVLTDDGVVFAIGSNQNG